MAVPDGRQRSVTVQDGVCSPAGLADLEVGQKMEIVTLIVAVIGGVTGLVNTVAIILMNGRLTA